MAPDKFLYEYAVVRFVPRVDRGEFINIGLVMMCKRQKWLRGEVRLNPERILALYPSARLETLARQASLFTRSDVPSADVPVEERYRWLTAVKSAVLQVSPSHPGLITGVAGADDPSSVEFLEREFQRLFDDLIP